MRSNQQLRGAHIGKTFKIQRIKRFREDEISPKDTNTDHLDNHYAQKVPHFQGTPIGGTPSSNLAAAGIELIALEKMNITYRRRFSRRKTWIKKTQSKIFHALERPQTRLAYCYHGFVFMLILASLSLSIIITCDAFKENKKVLNTVYFLEIALVLVFSFEYGLRIWSCSCHGNYKGVWGKMRFIKKPYMVIDIIVIVATTAVISTTAKDKNKADYFSVSLLRFLRFLQVLRVLRIDRQQGAFKMVSNVLYDHRQELITCCYMTFILIVSCSFLVYLAEKSDDAENDPSEMKDLSDGIYWGFITLSTIGYGDFSPQNAVAKWITVIFSFVGTAFFALPAGILGSGFAIQVAQNQKQKHINRRRLPAAHLIQHAWRVHIAKPYMDSSITWKRHQMRTYAKENRYSIYTGNDKLETPNSGRKSFAYLRKKFNSGRNSSFLDTDTRSRRSSIGATIPSALELRDRCQSEGNLLLVSPHNVEDNQATIVSLPQSVITDFVGVSTDKLHHYTNTNHEVYFKPLTETEKNAIRFVRKVKFGIAVRKFREQLRPYDIKDVLEQYSEGQMEMFSFMKRCQSRIECALGLKDNTRVGNTLHHRLIAVERKMDTLDEKLDVVLQLLRKEIPPRPPQHTQPEDLSGAGFQYAYNLETPYGDPNTPGEGNDSVGNPSIFINSMDKPKEMPHTNISAEELTKRLETLKQRSNEDIRPEGAFEYSCTHSHTGSDVSLDTLPDDDEEVDDRRASLISESRFRVTEVSPDNNIHLSEEMNNDNTERKRKSNQLLPSQNVTSDNLEYRRCSQQSNNSGSNVNSPVTHKTCRHGSLNSLNWNTGATTEVCKMSSKSVPVLNDATNTCATSNGHAGGRPQFINTNYCNGKRPSCERMKRKASSDSSTNSTPILSRFFAPKDSSPANCEVTLSNE